ETMANIGSKNDLETALQTAIKTGLISENDYGSTRKDVLQILEHPELKAYFEPGNTAYNEREILFKENVLRPDRINIQGDSAVIIDYKTGVPRESHEIQINLYAEAVAGLGFQIGEKLLVYANERVEVRKVFS